MASVATRGYSRGFVWRIVYSLITRVASCIGHCRTRRTLTVSSIIRKHYATGFRVFTREGKARWCVCLLCAGAEGMRKSRPAARPCRDGAGTVPWRRGSPTYHRPHRPLLAYMRWPARFHISSHLSLHPFLTSRNVCSVKGSGYGC